MELKHRFKPIVIGALSGAAAMLLTRVPALWMAALALPVAAGAALGGASLAAALLTAFAAALSMEGVIGLSSFALVLVACVPAYFAVKKSEPFEAGLVCCFASLMGIWALFYSVYLISGENLLKTLYDELPQLYSETLDSVASQAGLGGLLSAMQTDIVDLMRTMLPAVGLVMAFASGMCQLLLAVFAARKAKAEVTHLPEFSLWHIPGSFTWAVLALMLAGYIGVLAGWNGCESLLYCAQTLFTLVFALEGMCVAGFMFRAFDKPLIVIGAIASVVVFAFMPLTLLGIADGAFHFRARYLIEHGALPQRPGKTPPRFDEGDKTGGNPQ